MNRRGVFKRLCVGSAGVAVAAVIGERSTALDEGGHKAKEELIRLKEAYETLDARTKLILKLLLTATGIDFVSDLGLIVSGFSD